MSNYGKASIQLIFEYASKLTGESLSELVTLPEGIANQRIRGDLGSLLKKYYFQHKPPSNHGPDFPETGLELKTTRVILTLND